MRLGLALLAALALAPAAPAAGAFAPPPVKHVFVVVLENKGFEETWGPASKAPYLAQTLRDEGELLTQYYATGHLSNDNYISMVSGQGPNVENQADCQLFTDVFPGVRGPDGQALGQGCVFPAWVKTIGDQLTAKGLGWKAYLQGMERPCQHPPLGRSDPTQSATPGHEYATRHNPFVYFHSIIDGPGCVARDVALDELPADLASEAATPNYAFIVPDLCGDGHDAPCADGRPGGLASADVWLREWIPRILASPAYRDGGLLVITFDEAEAEPGEEAPPDARACCGERALNTPLAGIFGPGGGRIGALLLSPYIAPGSSSAAPYNHYSLLRSVEDLFDLGHLGYAARTGLRPFGADVYDGDRCFSHPLPAAGGGRFEAGTLIDSARIVRREGRADLLEVRGAHAADLYLRVDGRRVGPRRLHACRTVRMRLPAQRTSVSVAASVHAGAERRAVRS